MEDEQPSDKKNGNKMKRDQKQRGSLFGLFASKKKEKLAGQEPNGMAPPAADARGLDINKTTATVDSMGK